MALSDEHQWICETKNFNEARYYREKEADAAYLAGLARRRGATEEERPEPKQHRINTALKAEITALRSEVESLRQQLAAKVDVAYVQRRLEDFAALIGEETGKTDAKLLAEIKALKAEVAALKSEMEVLRQQKASKELAGVVSLRSRAS